MENLIIEIVNTYQYDMYKYSEEDLGDVLICIDEIEQYLNEYERLNGKYIGCNKRSLIQIKNDISRCIEDKKAIRDAKLCNKKLDEVFMIELSKNYNKYVPKHINARKISPIYIDATSSNIIRPQ